MLGGSAAVQHTGFERLSKRGDCSSGSSWLGGAEERVAAACKGPVKYGEAGWKMPSNPVQPQRDRGVEQELLPEKLKKVLARPGRVAASKGDVRIQEALDQVNGAAIRFSTSDKYESQWYEYVAFCVDLGVDPFLGAGDERNSKWNIAKDKDIGEKMVHFVLHRFVYYNNKHNTIRGYLSAIRWYFLEEGLDDPTKHSRLVRVMRGIKNLRGGVVRKEPVTPNMVQWIWERGSCSTLSNRAAATAVVVMFFFLLRVSEAAAQDSKTVASFVIKRNEVKFYKCGVECEWNEVPDEVSLSGSGDKVSNAPWFRNQYATGLSVCPVRALAEWVGATKSLVGPTDNLFSYRKTSEDEVNMVTRSHVSIAIKAAAVAARQSGADYGTHSCRIGAATALLQAGCSAHVVRLAGRWSSDAFRVYTRMTRTVMQGVSSDMFLVQPGMENRIQVGELKVR